MKLEYKNKKYNYLKQVLINEFKISKRLIVTLKKENALYVNNINVQINESININDIIKIDLSFPEKDNENILPVIMNLDIVYEDDSILVINKPYNMPVHPSILHFNDTLSNGVKYYFNEKNIFKKIRPVNRLDKDTTGLVIFAKNQYIQETLISQMKSGVFKKEYIAILEGYLETKNGTINAPISRKKGSIIEREINNNGDKSITHYKLIKNFNYNDIQLSLVRFVLETGRTHQIRVHSAHIGHPILGDSLYGKASELISRQALHSNKISFIHPITHNEITIETNIPDDIDKIIKV